MQKPQAEQFAIELPNDMKSKQMLLKLKKNNLVKENKLVKGNTVLKVLFKSLVDLEAGKQILQQIEENSI